MPLIERKRCHCRARGTYVQVDPERKLKASTVEIYLRVNVNNHLSAYATRDPAATVPVQRVCSHVRGQPNSEEVEEAEKKPVVAEVVVVIEEGASCSDSSIAQT